MERAVGPELPAWRANGAMPYQPGPTARRISAKRWPLLPNTTPSLTPAIVICASGIQWSGFCLMALFVIMFMYPLIGKFNKDGSANNLQGHNIPFGMLGTVILFFGWFGFNRGSSLGFTGTFGQQAANAAANTLVAGLIAITAVDSMAAAIIGSVAGEPVCLASFGLEKTGVDDPVGAVPVHLVNGIWGVIAVGLWATPTLRFPPSTGMGAKPAQ